MSIEQLLTENDDLKKRIKEVEGLLAEAEETLRAIHEGEVDAIVVSTPAGYKIFTLKGAEEPYRVLFDQMNEGALTISADGTVLYCNRRFAHAMKTSSERITGANLSSFIHPIDRTKLDPILASSLGGPVRNIVLFEAIDGSHIPMQLSISHLPDPKSPTFCLVVSDLTERLKQEALLKEANHRLEEKVRIRTVDLERMNAELKASEERFHSMADSIPQLVWMADPEGSRSWFNKRWLEYFGSTLEEQKGWGWLNYMDPEIVQVVKEMYLENIGTGEFWEDTISMTSKDGEVRWFLVQATAIKDDEGNIIHWFGTDTDITEGLATQQKLSKSNAELQRFAYVASHDIQEPLRMILGYIALLNKKYGNALNDQAKEYMSYVTDGANRLRDLINDLLDYSRIDTVDKPFVYVDLNKVVSEVIDGMGVSINESKAVITIGNLPTVWGDHVQLTQVLQNLISNALKFRAKEPPNIEINSIECENEFMLSVRDNGIGIEPKYQPKLFVMFQRLHTRDVYPGTGMGLAISKKIIEHHGGRIWVESDGVGGSTFSFSLPKT